MATVTTTPALPGTVRSPLTLWHLCSLDAPCVAAAWTVCFAHSFGIALPWGAPLALALAVWLLYVADRIRDASRGEPVQERHRFHREHRAMFALAAGCAVPVLLLLLRGLPHSLRLGWCMLAMPLFLYAAAVHILQWSVPKEPLVALFFAAATGMPLAANGSVGPVEIVMVTVPFALLCWANCTAIARWEYALRHADRCTAWAGKHFPLLIAGTVSAALPLLHTWHTTAAGLAMAAAAASLLLLDVAGRQLDRTVLRAMADAALLMPLLILPLLGRIAPR